MKRVFSKSKVLKLIELAGNAEEVTDEIMESLDNYDGCEAIKSGWDSMVYGVMTYIVTGKDGKRIKVPEEQTELV